MRTKKEQSFLGKTSKVFIERIISKLGRYDRATPTGSLGDGVTALRAGSVNCFLFDAGSARIAFDSGPPGRAMRRALLDAKLDGTTVTHLFLTHSDWDHTGGIPLFPNAKILLSRREEPLITGKEARVRWAYYNPSIDRPYSIVDDEQVLSIGNASIRVISTPGHTPGHCCYVVNEAFLFSGDTLALLHDRVRTFLPIFNWSTRIQRKSLYKLASDPVLEQLRLLCTAHTGFSRSVATAFSRWRDSP